jgi:hypothetical protein
MSRPKLEAVDLDMLNRKRQEKKDVVTKILRSCEEYCHEAIEQGACPPTSWELIGQCLIFMKTFQEMGVLKS